MKEMGIVKLEQAKGLTIEGKMIMINKYGALLWYYLQVLNL
jgi:hypothetical protein